MPGFDELAELLRRQLDASEVRWSDGSSPPDPVGGGLVLAAQLPSGQWLEARWDNPSQPRAALQERLNLLVTGLAGVLGASGRSSQPPPPVPVPPSAVHEAKRRALGPMLGVLAQRAAATQIVVIDARSPVLWGVAYGDADTLVQPEVPLDNVRFLRGAAFQPAPAYATARYARAVELGVAVADALVSDPAAARLVPPEQCEALGVMPLYLKEGTLLLAMADPTDLDAVRAVVGITGFEVEPVLLPPSLIRFAARWASRHAKAHGAAAARVPAIDVASPEAREQLAESTVQRLASRFSARRAIRLARGLPEIAMLRKGAHLNRTIVAEGQALLVRSFATIYLLLLVLPERFDELRVKHAVAQTLPAIESLILSLPPLTPRGPEGAAGALRRRR